MLLKTRKIDKNIIKLDKILLNYKKKTQTDVVVPTCA